MSESTHYEGDGCVGGHVDPRTGDVEQVRKVDDVALDAPVRGDWASWSDVQARARGVRQQAAYDELARHFETARDWQPVLGGVVADAIREYAKAQGDDATGGRQVMARDQARDLARVIVEHADTGRPAIIALQFNAGATAREIEALLLTIAMNANVRRLGRAVREGDQS